MNLKINVKEEIVILTLKRDYEKKSVKTAFYDKKKNINSIKKEIRLARFLL